MLNNKLNNEILTELNQSVYGHKSAKKALINALARAAMKQEHSFIETDKILLIGATGTGKTFLINQLAHITGLSYTYIDCSNLSPHGGNGFNTGDLIKKIGKEKHIVFLDEFDKLGHEYSDSAWRQGAQEGLLSVIDSKDKHAHLTFVMAGAFNQITQKRPTKNGIGFFAEQTSDSRELSDDDIVNCGIIPELAGRLTGVVYLDEFDQSDYEHMLTNYVLPDKIKELALFGVDDPFDSATILQITEKAVSSGRGVRTMKKLVNEFVQDMIFDYEEREIDHLVDVMECNSTAKTLVYTSSEVTRTRGRKEAEQWIKQKRGG